MKYRITAATKDSLLYYEADVYKRDGDYLTLTYKTNKSIINLAEFIVVDIEETIDE